MKRKKHKIQQNSPEWYDIRKGIFTSSNIADLFVDAKTNVDKAAGVLSKSAQDLIEEKALELYNGKPFVSDYENDAMVWGKENESIAAIEYQSFTSNHVSDGAFWTFGQNTGSSPDRLIFDDGVLEIKCPYSQLEHLFNIRNIKTASDLFKHRKKYFYQIHHQMYVTGRDYGEWVSFDPRMLDSKNNNAAMVVVKIEKDLNIWNQFDEKIQVASELRDKILNEILEYEL